ncbi:Octanoyl-[GcvH]:protein N-octanoyltransferase [compost metagenome]
MNELMQQHKSMVIWDRSREQQARPILYAFAMEELLCRRIGQGMKPILHIWRHPRAFVMGLRDSRLPDAKKAKEWLENQGYETAVRNSGGAAVPLDNGVVNMTLLLPKIAGDMDHRKDFERMYALIQQALSKLTDKVNKGEVIGSFCPGDFDLSIAGRKFCGIAQRRQQHAIAVQAFVIVEGRGADKAALAKAFYDKAAVGADPASYPTVDTGSMASLAECLQEAITSEQFVACVNEVNKEQQQIELAELLDIPSEADIQAMIVSMQERYGIRD